MIDFICPGCLSSHTANEAFAKLRARCVVCGATLRIPTVSGETAASLKPLPTIPRPGKSSRPANSRRPKKAADSVRTATEEPIPFVSDEADESLELLELNEIPEEEPRKKRKSKTAPNPEDTEGGESAIDREMRRAMDDEIERSETKVSEPVDELASRKKKIRIAGGGAVAIVLALVGYFALFDSKPKLPPLPASSSQDSPKVVLRDEESQPPPQPLPKKVDMAPAEPLPPPVAPFPRLVTREALPFAASRLLVERTENPVAFDKAAVGQVMLVCGTCGNISAEVIRLGDREADEGGILCLMRPGSVLPTLRPGQAVAICGLYTGDLALSNCDVIRVTNLADAEFKDKDIEITGFVALNTPKDRDPESNERFPTLLLESPLTDTLISVRCLFRATEKENLVGIRPGQPITVRGKCEGRFFRVVKLHDCTIVNPTEGVVSQNARIAAERFFAAYEADLLPVPRPDPAVPPISVTAERLAGAFGSDLSQANATYRYKTLEVTGRVLERRAQANLLVLETGTNQQHQVAIAFAPSRFAALRDERVITVRGTCVGIRQGIVRLENGDRFDADAANPATRTTAEYLPFRSGRETLCDFLTSEKAKDNHILRFQVSFIAPDMIRATPIRAGTFPAGTLFGDPTLQPKWTKDLTKPDPKSKTPPPPTRLTRFRVKDDTIEVREVPQSPTQSSWWDPVLKLGMKAGESWSFETPDGLLVTYTVTAFSKGERNRQQVEIRRVLKNAKEAAAWEESKITYALGIGEISRVTTGQTLNGPSPVGFESRLVEEATDAKPPEKK